MTIKDNILIGAKKGKAAGMDETNQWDPVALIHMYTNHIPSEDLHDISGNIGQSSEGIGFAFPGTPCEEKD